MHAAYGPGCHVPDAIVVTSTRPSYGTWHTSLPRGRSDVSRDDRSEKVSLTLCYDKCLFLNPSECVRLRGNSVRPISRSDEQAIAARCGSRLRRESLQNHYTRRLQRTFPHSALSASPSLPVAQGAPCAPALLVL